MSEREPDEPIVLDYARPGLGRLATLWRSGADPQARKAGLRLWAFVTLGLYLAAALAIYVPLVVFCFWERGNHDHWKALRESFAAWQFWLILGTFLIAQVLLLVVPVRAAWDYQIKPRRMVVPIATTCTLLAILVAGALFSEIAVVVQDKYWSYASVGCLFVVGASWLVWWRVFRRYARADVDQVMDVTRRWLLHGSILELLVAISCHIWVRRRGDCSSPAFTFLAICAGFATMLCAFGPGVFYLLVARVRRMSSKGKRESALARDARGHNARDSLS